jgi:hypothetical protein
MKDIFRGEYYALARVVWSNDRLFLARAARVLTCRAEAPLGQAPGAFR